MEKPVEKAILSWSGGKDSALALYELRRTGLYDVVGLVTTVTEDYGRVSMHGVREALLAEQAEALGLALLCVTIPADCSNEVYEKRMRKLLEEQTAFGVFTVAFGDIFLEDLRQYRESRLAEVSMKAVFPLWKRDTRSLARSFVQLGFKAVVTCVDSQALDGWFAGRDFDESFLRDLPAGVDPCGENGEFHSFVWDGPVFARPVPIERGEVVVREGRFWFCDLLPGVTGTTRPGGGPGLP